MKKLLISLCLLAPLLLLAQPLAPYRHNFFTTNPAPVVEVLAGSNVAVQLTLTGTDHRSYTVSATINTNGFLANNQTFTGTNTFTVPIIGTLAAAVITNQVSAASFSDFLNVGTTVVISPTNGNLQSWILTAASSASLDAANTNFTQTLRLNVYGSNTLTWTTTTLSNSTVLVPSNSISVMLFDHARNTNLWWGYRMR